MYEADKTDISVRQGDAGYISAFIAMIINVSNILASPEFTKEPMRVYYLSNLLISMIPEESKRKEIRVKLDNILATNGIDSKEITEQERKHIQINASIEVIGYVTDFIDEHLGLSIENRLGLP